MEESEESEIKTGSKWKGIVIIAFTVIAVSGMMYMLFTVDDYNKYGSGSDSSSAFSSADSLKNDSASAIESASYPKPEKKTPESSPQQATSLKETPPVVNADPVTQPSPAPTVETKPPTKVIVKAQPVNIPKPIAKAEIKQPPVAVVKPKPPVVAKPVVKPVINNTTNTKPGRQPANTPKPIAKEDKVMSNEELQQLTKNLLEKGAANGGYAKCVQLHNTASGNNKTTMRQIESYLRSQKFTIAGRQIVSSNIKGYQITTGDGCTRLIVGSF